MFRAFISYLTNQRIQIIFYLPPYEPSGYRFVQSNINYQNINNIEHYYLSIANEYHIRVIGSYDPNKLQLTSNDFIDYIHVKGSTIEKIFNNEISTG